MKRYHVKRYIVVCVCVCVCLFVYKQTTKLRYITLEQSARLDKNRPIIFLFRHGERCDRSEKICYADSKGITVNGVKKTLYEGFLFSKFFHEYDIYSSNAVRTIQTARFFSGKEPVIKESLSTCKKDLYDLMDSIILSSNKRAVVLVTHNHCLVFLAKDMLGKEFSPAYLDALVIHHDGTQFVLDGVIPGKH
ncbi:TPA: lipopolysaccharide core heptose(II)-phosphate phosphatase [Escherichia coli]|nr:lipopolysaccharide core heptose(II)-phosphate phosphatase [Escherichia coli]